MLRSILFWLVVAASAFNAHARTAPEAPVPEEKVNFVSLIQLIADPARFDGKRVSVEGFCSVRFEANALFVHEEDMVYHLPKNAVWLDLPKEKLTGDAARRLTHHYARIEGTFSAKKLGQKDHYSGTIERITYAESFAAPGPRR